MNARYAGALPECAIAGCGIGAFLWFAVNDTVLNDDRVLEDWQVLRTKNNLLKLGHTQQLSARAATFLCIKVKLCALQEGNVSSVDGFRSNRGRGKADGGGNDLLCLGIAAAGWAFGLLSHCRANKASSEAQKATANAQNFEQVALQAQSQLKAGQDEKVKLKEYGEELASRLEAAKKELAELSTGREVRSLLKIGFAQQDRQADDVEHLTGWTP